MGVWGEKCLKYSVACDDTNWDLVLPGILGHMMWERYGSSTSMGEGLCVQGILPLFGREAVLCSVGLAQPCSLCSSADQLKTLCHCKLADELLP